MRGLAARIFQETTDANHPLSALLELTYTCNSRCRHCYINSRSRRGEMTTHEWVSVLDQLASAGALFLTLSGGEPLLRRDFFEVAAESRRLGFALRIYSNGTRIDAKASQRIAALTPLAVEISLYGARAGTHDAITGVLGSFDKTIRGVRNLLHDGVRVNLKTPVMRSNWSEYPEIQDWAGKLGAHLYPDTQIVPSDGGDPCPTDLNLDAAGLMRFYRSSVGRKRPGAPSAAVRRGRREGISSSPMCNAGRNTLAISPSGDVYPCVQIRWSAGNLKREKFSAIWATSPVLLGLRALSVRDFADCAACGLFDDCSPCPGVAALETGNLLGCSPLARRHATVSRAVGDHSAGYRGAVRGTGGRDLPPALEVGA